MSSFTERQQRVTNTAGTLIFLEVSAPSFTGPMRIVNDTHNWTSNGMEYVAVPFGFTLPDDVSGQTSKAQLVMDNVGRDITAELERVGPNETVMARMRLSDRAAPDVIARELLLPLSNVSVSGTTATATCGMDAIMRQQAVRLRANPFTLPGIFA